MNGVGTESDGTVSRSSRRRFLAVTGVAVTGGFAGCPGGNTTTPSQTGTPSGVGGLRLWLHPESGRTTGDGGIETWRDDSGNGYDVTQTDPAARPSLVEDAAGGNAALRFDGADDHFVRMDTLGIPDESPRTCVVVSKLSDPGSRSPFLMQGTFGSTGTDSNYWGLEANSYGTDGERFGAYLTSYGYDAELETDTDYHVHTLRTATFPGVSEIRSSTSYYVDGAQTPITTAGGGADADPFRGDSTGIGAFPVDSPSALLGGEIAEVRVYDRALDDSDRSTVETELLERYGIDPA